MRKRSLYFVLIFSVLIFGVYGLENRNRIVETDIVKVDISKLSGTLQDWVTEHTTEGVYIGRIPKTNKKEEYYVYLNLKGANEFSVRNDGFKGLAVNWVQHKNYTDDISTELFKITSINKKSDYIIFGKKRMNISSIPIIKE